MARETTLAVGRAMATARGIEQRVHTLPFGGKLSREKTFAFSEPSVQVFSVKFCGRTYIIIGPEKSAKGKFSAACTHGILHLLLT